MTIEKDDIKEDIIIINYLGEVSKHTHILSEAIERIKPDLYSVYKGSKININRCQIEYLRIPK